MLYNDPNQPGQHVPSSTYPPYRPTQVAHPEQPIPVTDKVPSVQAPPTYQPMTWQQPGLHWQQPVAAQKPKRSRGRSVTIFILTCLLAVVFGVGLFSGWTFAHSSTGTSTSLPTSSSSSGSLSALEFAREAAIAKVEPAVVEIDGTTNQGESLGSGVIIDSKGDIVTNNHVVSGASSLTVVLNNGSSETAQVVGEDPTTDLAIIRIQPFANMTVATLGNSSQLTVGQEVLAIGNPLGYTGTATNGVVSALNRSTQESRNVTLTSMIQTSAAINPGNSGGALINLQGQVIGIPTLTAVDNETNTPANGIGFAIPSNRVQSLVAKIVGS